MPIDEQYKKIIKKILMSVAKDSGNLYFCASEKNPVENPKGFQK